MTCSTVLAVLATALAKGLSASRSSVPWFGRWARRATLHQTTPPLVVHLDGELPTADPSYPASMRDRLTAAPERSTGDAIRVVLAHRRRYGYSHAPGNPRTPH
jgi:dienelactone hydrolase